MHPVARVLIAFIVWLAAAALLAPICFFMTVFLAGPHSDMLPSVLQPPVWLLGWAVFLLAPLALAQMAWRRTHRQ